jgi:DNA-binding response OmpR family regulator
MSFKVHPVFNVFSIFYVIIDISGGVHMRILLVEDEKRMAQALCELLRLEKYEVDHFANGLEGLTALESNIYDIAILDVMLPGMNGYEITRNARSSGITTPILMLTAKAELDDKVVGLDSGADDYLTKPFMTKELLARLRALSRRRLGVSDGLLSYGDITLDTCSFTLTCVTNGQSVRLSEKEYRILEYLIVNGDQILTREQLAVKIWGFESDAEYNNVEVYMSFTRKKLAFVAAKTEIKAVRGIGYELRYDDV